MGALWAATHGQPATTARSQATLAVTVDYQREIHPVLAARCLTCHSSDKRSGGLSLASYAQLLEGGRSGTAIRPGDPDSSLLLHRLTGEIAPAMPLGLPPLSAGEIDRIRTWIREGARETPSGAPARTKWEPPLALERPPVPGVVWKDWTSPIDRLVAAYFMEQRLPQPAQITDAQFARRVYLDIWGLLPPPGDLDAFLADRRSTKRTDLIARLLADDGKYAEHWISFWNDLLRNEEGVNYHSETATRKSITEWLLAALAANRPYDVFVEKLLNPAQPGDPDGFLTGVNWRGEINASQTPAMQAAQNAAQIFIGVNLKCNSCHDSFISRWKLKDAYALASFFAPDGRLRLYRCDVAQDEYADPSFLYPQLNRAPPSASLADRRATAAAIFTDPRNGRLARTVVNRFWQRLLGRGIVGDPDDMDGEPWSPALLDWLASDFVAHNYDLKHLIATIVSSRAYQLPAVARTSERIERYRFLGPEIRRLTAEQFSDAIATITGEWNVYQPPATPGTAAGPPPVRYTREWRTAANALTRALGRPIRDQVFSTREALATTPQALELVNGARLTTWLVRGARHLTGQRPPPAASLFVMPINVRGSRFGDAPPAPSAASFDVEIAGADRLWLVVQDANSTAIDKAQAVWARGELVAADGTITPLTALTPVDDSALRVDGSPLVLGGDAVAGVRVKMPSRLVYDVSGRGFARFRGVAGMEHVSSLAQGETVLGRFLIFGAEPDLERLVPPAPGTPLPPPPRLTTPAQAVDWIFRYALGRRASADERAIAEDALRDAERRGGISVDGLADLLWAVVMKPEFQLIY